MSIIGTECMSVPPLYPHVCSYNSHSNAIIMPKDLTHLTKAPPNIPKRIHSTEVFCDIFIHPLVLSFVHPTFQTDREGLRYEKHQCAGVM